MRIEESVTIGASRQDVWERTRDPADYPALLDWVTSFDPHDPQREPEVGRGMTCACRWARRTWGLVEIVEYEPCAEIVWTSITGVDQRGRLRLRDSGEGQVELTMRVSYGAPGELLGTLAELLSVPQVSGSVKRSLGNLKHEVEGTERPAPARASRSAWRTRRGTCGSWPARGWWRRCDPISSHASR